MRVSENLEVETTGACPDLVPGAHISVTYEDTGAGVQASSNEIDTIAATGFNLTTQVNGNYHWLATWTA